MACCGPQSGPTPLQRYAQSLHATSAQGAEEDAQMVFPMYTVALDDILAMTKIEPHEALQAKGMLVDFDGSQGQAAFVSHQWVDAHHPDPDFRQMRIFQDALRHLLSDMQHVPLDLGTDTFVPGAKPLATKAFKERPLFFWYDYFSCPQLEKDDLTASQTNRLANAISSIPAYITRCAFFFALCPVIDNPSQGKVFTVNSWCRRGWCRVERACRELSVEGTWILIQSETQIQLLSSLAFPSGSVGEGEFTVPVDRYTLTPVLAQSLLRRMHLYLHAQDFVGYRTLLNMQSAHLRGLAAEPVYDCIPGFEYTDGSNSLPVAQFLYQNGFAEVREVDKAGWAPLHYAALRGDASLIEDLLKHRADINRRAKNAKVELGLPPGLSCLDLCMLFKQNDAARLLLAARAGLADGYQPAILSAAHTNNGEGVRMLCEHGSGVTASSPVGLSCFDTACSYACLEAIHELARHADEGVMDRTLLSRGLVCAGVIFGCTAELVDSLLSLRADVNYQFSMQSFNGLGQLVVGIKSLQHRFGNRSFFSTVSYHYEGLTPLMAAVLTGQYEGAAALIAAGARLDLRNSRNWTAADFARRSAVPDFLAKGLQGEPSECERITQLALEGPLVEVRL